MVRTFIIILALTILLSACQTEPLPPAETTTPLPPTSTPGVPETIDDGDNITIFVDPRITHQTIKYVTGGNQCI